jgi:hypothetical protein
MDLLEYLKIPIEDKDTVYIAEHFSKVYHFIEAAFNHKISNQGSQSQTEKALDFLPSKISSSIAITDIPKKQIKQVVVDFKN